MTNFQHQAFGKRNESMFGGAISRSSGKSILSGERCYVNDVPFFAFQHEWEKSLCAIKAAVQIGFEGSAEIFFFEVQYIFEISNSCVVDQDLRTAKSARYFAGQIFDFRKS